MCWDKLRRKKPRTRRSQYRHPPKDTILRMVWKRIRHEARKVKKHVAL